MEPSVFDEMTTATKPTNLKRLRVVVVVLLGVEHAAALARLSLDLAAALVDVRVGARVGPEALILEELPVARASIAFFCVRALAAIAIKKTVAATAP